MKIEQTVNIYLNNHPKTKKIIKRVYQRVIYSISPKTKSEGNIERITPLDGKEYFFGYYDKSPWDSSGRYMLCLRADNTRIDPEPLSPVELLLIDTYNGNKIKIGESKTWNVQQGCMLQWMGPDFKERVIYNDFRDGKFCSVIFDIITGKERILQVPVYSVAESGQFALTLDFTRLHRLRKGYGYANIEESTKNEKIPNTPCVWMLDLGTNTVCPILKYTDLYNFETKHEMIGAEHKVNHIMINPSGNRFMLLHRWIKNHKKYSRLITSNIDGSDLYNLSDDNMVSHCCWKNDNEILAYENKFSTGPGYYLMKDKSDEYTRLWETLTLDGHPSYSPDKTMVVTDSYPDRRRISSIKILKEKEITTIAQVFSPFKYDNETRCDLHPRWSRDGKKICFDGVFEGQRGLYVINL